MTGDRRPPIVANPQSGSSVCGRPSLSLRVKCLLTRLPLCLTQAAGLQRLNHSQSFLGGASDVQIVYNFVPQNSFGIDNEEAAQGDATIFNQHTVVARNVLSRVGGQRIYQSFHTALIARCLDPGPMGKDRVS